MAWFQHRRSDSPALDNLQAEELLTRAQASRAQGDLVAARSLAREALDLGERVHGERGLALIPFLLVYAGVLNQCLGWAAGKPFYERAERLRGLATAFR
ncbi:MAG: hypothetical protein ABI639_02765 [Thermoanaerobaculia bacterium]